MFVLIIAVFLGVCVLCFIVGPGSDFLVSQIEWVNYEKVVAENNISGTPILFSLKEIKQCSIFVKDVRDMGLFWILEARPGQNGNVVLVKEEWVIDSARGHWACMKRVKTYF